MLSRKFTRILLRSILVLPLLALAVFVFDLWYDFLPSSLQTRLPLHTNHPVLVDVKIETCGLFSSCSGSGHMGWYRHDKDLYLGTSWFKHAYFYTRSVNQDELERGEKVVLAIAHTPHSGDIPPEIIEEAEISPVVPDESLRKEPPSALAWRLGWQSAGHGMWVKRGKHVPGQEVTGVKILFSQSAVCSLPGWRLPLGSLGIGRAEPRVAYHIGFDAAAAAENAGTSGAEDASGASGASGGARERPVLRFNRNGKFKIVQLADLHMSTGWGKCDCPEPKLEPGEQCLADLRTEHLVEDVLHEEAPDLVVFSGDQIYADSSPDPETALLKALNPVLERKLPFALIFGNHDETDMMSRMQMMRFVERIPLFVGSAGREDVPGVGNYIVTVAPPQGSAGAIVDAAASAIGAAPQEYPALSLYFVDSHSRLPEPHTVSVYDWIKSEQLEWLRGERSLIAQRLNGYSKVPLAMAFAHIPVPEFRDDLIDEGGQSGLARIGKKREGVVAPSVDEGALETMRDIGVSVLGVGHDHANDYCQLQQAHPSDAHPSQSNIWLCYGGGTGEGGYGGYPDENGLNYERRARVYEFDMNSATVESWHRVQNHDAVVNRVRLVVGGEAVYVAKEDTVEEGDRITEE